MFGENNTTVQKFGVEIFFVLLFLNGIIVKKLLQLKRFPVLYIKSNLFL